MYRHSIRTRAQKGRDGRRSVTTNNVRRWCHCGWCIDNLTMGMRRDRLRAEDEFREWVRARWLGET